jgi:hypothetical protein
MKRFRYPQRSQISFADGAIRLPLAIAFIRGAWASDFRKVSCR